VAEGFPDRAAGGRALAERLAATFPDDAARDRVVVLALPRGGVPVAAEVATALAVPLDVLVVRKLGVPRQPELGMGAIGEDGVRVLNDDVVRTLRITPDAIARVEARERTELERRALAYRGGAAMVPLTAATAVIVDDGIATGGTARAAVAVARAHGAERVVIATPVAPVDTVRELRAVADDVVVVATPSPFFAIGQWYADFRQTTDAEVARALSATRPERSG
jgi:predicted phosphoribosyltransferase